MFRVVIHHVFKNSDGGRPVWDDCQHLPPPLLQARIISSYRWPTSESTRVIHLYRGVVTADWELASVQHYRHCVLNNMELCSAGCRWGILMACPVRDLEVRVYFDCSETLASRVNLIIYRRRCIVKQTIVSRRVLVFMYSCASFLLAYVCIYKDCTSALCSIWLPGLGDGGGELRQQQFEWRWLVWIKGIKMLISLLSGHVRRYF